MVRIFHVRNLCLVFISKTSFETINLSVTTRVALHFQDYNDFLIDSLTDLELILSALSILLNLTTIYRLVIRVFILRMKYTTLNLV